MRTRLLAIILGVLTLMTMSGSSYAVSATAEEMADAARWLEERLLGDAPTLPFSFTYGDKASSDLLPGRRRGAATRKLDEHRTQHTLTYADPDTGLEVRCVAVVYDDYPTVEWTLYLHNTGSADTPIISDIRALDAHLPSPAEGQVILHHQTGGQARRDDFQPFVTPLASGQPLRFAAGGGRPSNAILPYFDLQWPTGGVLIAIGWPGQWSAEFALDNQSGLSMRAGQELTHFLLHPGEEVRTPLVAVQFYRGDRVRAHNIWRRWMLDHNVPRCAGKLPPPHMAACSSHQFNEMINANEENQKQFIDGYRREKLPLDYWWMDAGWYPNSGNWWDGVGNWEVDRKRFPNGLRAISDYAHAKGIKIITWFEPERVYPGTWLDTNHRQWLLGKDGDNKLFDLGNPEARAWLTDHVDGLLTDQGIDLYRQDFNMDPLAYWRANDAPDRQGISEAKHVMGYLGYWDELRRRHPDMLIDTCASGGRRLDLETLRRSVPLLRSDYILEPVGQQGHTYGLAFWIPLFGTGVNVSDAYTYRSQMCYFITACYDVRRTDLDYDSIRRLTEQRRQIAPYYTGDYYPLTSYSLDNEFWIGWQFDRPDLGEGMVQAFRRAASPYVSARFQLQGLDPDATYTIRNLDDPGETHANGRELMEPGLTITIRDQPGAVVLTYKR
jgi:alpha-galactosidase